ncbi:ABC transporter permease [Candidatus Neomarinimicrobiota bacterium]
MTPHRQIALVYLRSRHSYGFISLIGYLGMIGLAIGVAALILTLGVMDGFQDVVEDKVAAMDGHLRITNMMGDNIPLPDSLLMQITAHQDVAGVTPILTGHALAKKGRRSEGIMVLGTADFNDLGQAIDLLPYIVSGGLPQHATGNGLVLGAKLADNLGVGPGDNLHLIDISYLVDSQGLRAQEFTISGIYRSGMVEYDQLLAFANLNTVSQLFGRTEAPSTAIIDLYNRDAAERVAAELEEELGFPYYLSTWRSRHANLFNWLTGQQLPILIIFGFIALVAVLNILSTLTLVVIEKYRDIGILLSIGFSTVQIRKIFLFQGGIVGLIGSAGGLVLALLLGWLQSYYGLINLDADIYFMDTLPIKWSLPGLLTVPVLAWIIALFAAYLPARRAARITPAEALRYE